LIKAADRGVDVKILTPGKSDVPFVKWAAFNLTFFLLQKKIPIFEYQPSILHAKNMIIDDEAFVGSYNLNYRSLIHDLEVQVILNDASSLQNMLAQWQIDLGNSKPATEKDFNQTTWIGRLMHKIAFRLRYLL
jgi:cardiolipin synthase